MPNLPRTVNGVAVGIRIAGLVKPVTSPPLAVSRRRQHAVDEPFVAVRAGIALEFFHFIGTRRQPPKIKTEAADQRGSISLG